jgi:LEA14-like dessication related protein
MKTWFRVVKSVEACQILKRCLASCLAGLLVIYLSSCGGLSKKPEITLAGIDFVGLGLIEQRFVLKLAIRNPNEVDLPVNALDFDVELNGSHFARGASERPLVVPRRGESVLEVMTVSRLGNGLKQMREAQKEGRDRMAFRIYGNAEVEGFGRLPFERMGEIPVVSFGKFMPD